MRLCHTCSSSHQYVHSYFPCQRCVHLHLNFGIWTSTSHHGSHSSYAYLNLQPILEFGHLHLIHHMCIRSSNNFQHVQSNIYMSFIMCVPLLSSSVCSSNSSSSNLSIFTSTSCVFIQCMIIQLVHPSSTHIHTHTLCDIQTSTGSFHGLICASYARTTSLSLPSMVHHDVFEISIHSEESSIYKHAILSSIVPSCHKPCPLLHFTRCVQFCCLAPILRTQLEPQ